MPGPSCTSLLAKTTSAFCTKEEKRERNYDKKTTKMKKAYVKLGSLSDYQWACHPCLKGWMRKRKTIPMKNCDSALEFKQFFYMKTVRQKKTTKQKPCNFVHFFQSPFEKHLLLLFQSEALLDFLFISTLECSLHLWPKSLQN